MKKILMSLSLFAALNSMALEIDEKLTMRILDTSVSKKTILLNRGLEDGLVVGDHAKFFITTGVVARGVVVKASPSRSIWSVYRIIKPEELSKGLVANLKISTAVKLTMDSTKSIRALAVPVREMGEPKNIYKPKEKVGSMTEAQEISSLMQDGNSEIVTDMSQTRSSSTHHGLEISGLLSMSSLSGTYTDGNSGDSLDAKNSAMNFSGAIEKYFPTYNNFLKNMSIKAILNRTSQERGTGINRIATFTDCGLGLSYYFGKGPFRNNSLLYFVDGNMGISAATLETQDNSNVANNTSASIEGSGSFLSVGIGAKYLVGNKFGAIGKLDYYKNTTTFEIDDGSGNINSDEYALAGPRVMFGLFYRFF